MDDYDFSAVDDYLSRMGITDVSPINYGDSGGAIDLGSDFSNFNLNLGLDGMLGNDSNMIDIGNGYSYGLDGNLNQIDMGDGSIPTSSNNTQLGQLLAGLGLSAGTANTLGTLGSIATIGTNMYQDYQTNELQQALLKQQAAAQKANLKLGDANTYMGYTKGASDEITNARDNLLLRQYMEQTQPYNREREFAILGKDGVDTSKMRAMTNNQNSGLSDYVSSLLGYENQFKGFANDLTGMRDQSQLYNTLQPTQGALNTMAVSQPPQQSFDWMSTVPQGADPAQVAAYQQFLTSGQG